MAAIQDSQATYSNLDLGGQTTHNPSFIMPPRLEGIQCIGIAGTDSYSPKGEQGRSIGMRVRNFCLFHDLKDIYL